MGGDGLQEVNSMVADSCEGSDLGVGVLGAPGLGGLLLSVLGRALLSAGWGSDPPRWTVCVNGGFCAERPVSTPLLGVLENCLEWVPFLGEFCFISTRLVFQHRHPLSKIRSTGVTRQFCSRTVHSLPELYPFNLCTWPHCHQCCS